MIDYNTIKNNSGKTIKIKKHSSDTFKLAEMIDAVGFEKESKFKSRMFQGYHQIMSGFVVFINKCTVEIKNK